MNELNKKPRYQVIEGLPLPLSVLPEIFHSSKKYSPEKRDVVITSYPKCGATWVSHIVNLILRKGQPCTSADEYFSSIPFLEMVRPEALKYAPKPRCIKTHLPLNRMKLVYEAKYIYVARHPIDLVVPLYHHIKSFPTYFFSDDTFDEFLDLFCKGDLPYGDYYEHFSSGYAGRLQRNVLFLTYHEIKNDTRAAVLKIADFIKEFYYVKFLTTVGGKALKDILYCCSSEYSEKTIEQFWKELLTNEKPSEEYQSLFPGIKKSIQLLKEAEDSGHYPVDESDEEIVFTEEHKKKLEKYIFDKTYGDYFPFFNDWKPTET